MTSNQPQSKFGRQETETELALERSDTDYFGTDDTTVNNNSSYLGNRSGYLSAKTHAKNTAKNDATYLQQSTNPIEKANENYHTAGDTSNKNKDTNLENKTYAEDRVAKAMHLENKAASDHNAVSERLFMNSLLKHTGIALAIIVPLAAFSAYAATPTVGAGNSSISTSSTKAQLTTNTEKLSVPASTIKYNAEVSSPTTVDNVDLAKYSGVWYEIGRLPMYFQRNCASDVTATYTPKSGTSDISVLNQCAGVDGADISADGLAKPVDASGSKLKVTFLPSWIRWLPVGRADYWILARDNDYKTALVGTPDKEYLWLLARSPNIDQQTYAKYRQIAQQQGYNLKEFKLTPHASQTTKLIP